MKLSFRFVSTVAGPLLAFAVACGDDGPTDVVPDASGVCSTAADCSDGQYCNGQEVCAPDDAAADIRGCAAGPLPCEEGVECDEDLDMCVGDCVGDPDADGDGRRSVACGGDDCDDADPNRYPGNTEICDVDNHDEDCDPTTYGFRDQDMDGSPDAMCCNEDESGELTCGSDCNDLRPGVSPDEAESCDGRDNDCDGDTDEGVLETFYVDVDGDSFGDATAGAATMDACVRPDGYADNADDCDDSTTAINPGNPEVCDAEGVDENCDGDVNPVEECSCTTGESRACTLPGECSGSNQDCIGGTWGACSISPVPEVCNGLNDDCDGNTDETLTVTCYRDDDNDSYPAAGAPERAECPDPGRLDFGQCPLGTTNRPPVDDPATGTINIDCDDTSAPRRPGGTEACNGLDDDCDGMADEGVSIVCYVDGDNDTYAAGGAPMMAACSVAGREFVGGCAVGTTDRAPSAGNADCDDTSALVNPAGTETCNGLDDDCSGAIDEGVQTTYYVDSDSDGYGSDDPAAATETACFRPMGYAEDATDCDDSVASVNPGNRELCDAEMVDEDCDGTANPAELCSCSAGDSRPCNLEGACAAGTEECLDGSWGACSIAPITEICNGVNDDCDGATDEGLTVTCFADGDNDGYAEAGAAESQRCPDSSRGDVGSCPSFTTNRQPFGEDIDCNDDLSSRAPGATELCNGEDDDCDGGVDEGASITCWADGDGDTYALASAAPQQTCQVAGREFVGGCPAGFTNIDPTVSADCNDTSAAERPTATETCNERDDDCDGTTDEGVQTRYWRDADGDGFGSADVAAETVDACIRPDGFQPTKTDCNDARGGINPGVPEICDAGGEDENCDGVANPASLCTCTNGETRGCTQSGVCAGGTEACSGGAWEMCSIQPVAEVCDGLNNDCDGSTDEGLTVTCYADFDNDGYPASGAAESQQCPDGARTAVGGCPALTTNRVPLGTNIDCADGNATRNPGATESCNNLDDDCDGTIDEGVSIVCYADGDGDTYPLATALPQNACTAAGRGDVGGCPVGLTNRSPAVAPDCDDGNSAASPAGSEVCNGVDDDCNGTIDDGVTTTYYEDTDGDGFGSMDPAATTIDACFRPDGFQSTATDCNDGNGAINPAAVEVCDMAMVDENCDGTANPGTLCDCSDGDSRSCTLPGACAAGTETCNGGAWGSCSIQPISEACNGIDDDCSGQIDEGLTVVCYTDDDNDGYAESGAASSNECPDSSRPDVGGCPTLTTNRVPFGEDIDCNDTLSSVRPGQTETCDGIDNDCNGSIDEGVSVTCYTDLDGDTYAGDGALPMTMCPSAGREFVGGCPVNTTNVPPGTSADCDDTDSTVNPGATEICDADLVDDDCDGVPNQSAVCECANGSTRSCADAGAVGVCASGIQTCSDGMWGSCSIQPAASEICNGADDDCNGTIDEGVTVACYEDGDDDTYPLGTATVELVCPAPGRGVVGGCPFQLTDVEPLMSTTDCDDDNATVNPGGTEICDAGGADEDCDGTANPTSLCSCTDGATQSCPPADSRCSSGTQTCSGGAWGACSVSPIAETCNGIDDDCDGQVDNGVTVTCYADADDDGYPSSTATPTQYCPDAGRPGVGGCPTGFTDIEPSGSTIDCDETDDAINPGEAEICDAARVDQDCDGDPDPNPPCECLNGDERSCADDGYVGACASGIQTCSSGSWSSCSIQPGSTEGCNSIDDDCDGATDEFVTTTCYDDPDADGYAAVGATTSTTCSACPAGTTATVPSGTNIDCRENDADSYPGADELCDRIDNDCSDGGGVATAEDADNDGHTRDGYTGCNPNLTGSFPDDDCADYEANAYPGQTSYIRTGYCPPDYPQECDDGRCASWVVIDCTSGAVDKIWDYDCDTNESVEPASTGCGCMGFPVQSCGGGGPIYSGSATCGQSATRRVCGLEGGGFCGSFGTTCETQFLLWGSRVGCR